MARTATITAVAVAALFTFPAASATWMSYGSFEPDTPYDLAGFMWEDPPGAATKRVYFNVYAKWGDPGVNGAYVNPNVGALRTRLDPSGPTTWQGFLGVWTDCNGDGYIGMAETAAREYKAELLLDDSICPALATGSVQRWPAGQNNYRGWVTELIPIGNRESRSADTRIYIDDEAMVWGDPGRPEDDWPQAVTPCFLTPVRGEARSTGGLLRWIDCHGNRDIVSTYNTVDAALGLGNGFEDPANPQDSSSSLNAPTFGDDGTEHSAVYAQDCSAEPIARTGDLPGGDFDNKSLGRLPPANILGDPSQATVPGTLNQSIESIPIHETCDTSDDGGRDFYGRIESNPIVGQENGKITANWNFQFNTASRGTLPATALGGGAAGVPTDFGIEALGIECGASNCMQSMWVGGTSLTYTTPVTRGTLQDLSVDGDETTLAGAPRWSFYAYVGGATTGRGFQLPGNTLTYGATQCDGATAGEHHGWNCDVTAWYRQADGSYAAEPRPFARPGQLYNLRDVDCMDGRLGEFGVAIDPSALSTDPCV